MLSINTNLSSIIAQNSMTQSTNALNEAIERMTTGFKINHASDNAANYSISTNMTTKLGAYQIAEENAAMGLDMVTTAQDNIAQMESHAERLRSLSIQARNGTYGGKSLGAIQSEVNSIVSEMLRIHSTTKYNGISLFDNVAYEIPDTLPKAGENGFIDEDLIDIKPEYNGFLSNPFTYSETDINNMDKISSVSDTTTITDGEYAIWNENDLLQFRKMCNNGYIQGGTFVLAADIDLKEYCENNTWYGIIMEGEASFDGNGHIISNLKGFQGLFSSVNTTGYIWNIGLKNVEISSTNTAGGLVDHVDGIYEIWNCFVDGGSVTTSSEKVGGLIGLILNHADIFDCYSTVKVTGSSNSDPSYNSAGGLIGFADTLLDPSCYVANCYATGDVSGTGNVGGLVGDASFIELSNCYATGNVTGIKNVGGLVGYTDNPVYDCYATGDVVGTECVGGLIGYGINGVSNSYATGDVIGMQDVGGLVGTVNVSYNDSYIFYSYSSGNVTGTDKVGSFIGNVNNTDDNINFGYLDVMDCYTISDSLGSIGGCYDQRGDVANYDTTQITDYIASIKPLNLSTNLQVGIHGNEYSNLSFDSNFKIDLSSLLTDISSDESLKTIDDFIKTLSGKQTELGAVQNRLESALEEISVQYDNLVSSRSTLRDADIAEVSSHYIQQQILQQASATLMATANQSPSIALQLI